MPSASDYIANDMLLRVLAYGPAKQRKTWWALNAALAGFRVILFDTDRGAGIVSQIAKLAPEALPRIFILDCADATNDAFASYCVTCALKYQDFYINEERHIVKDRPFPGAMRVNMREFGRDTVVIFDSWTAICTSLIRQFSIENKIDMAEANKTEWPGYGWAGRLATWMLTQMKTLPCHMVLIGHSMQYEKYKRIVGSDGKQQQGPLEWSRRQVASTSNPHGMTVPKDFTDVLYFHGQSNTATSETVIDTRGNDLEDAGSRHIPPHVYKWADMQFGHLCVAAGIPLPTNTPAWQFETVAAAPPSPGNPFAAPVAATPAASPPPATIQAAPPQPTAINLRGTFLKTN